MNKKIDFRGFWNGFDYKGHSAFNWIVDHFNLEINSDNPDVIVYSCFSNYLKSDKPHTRVFFTGERISPDFEKYDFAFTFDYSEDPRNFRFPLYLWSHDTYFSLSNRSENKKNWASKKTKFCNFIYGNGNTNMDGVKRRIDFFNSLSKYKKVDSGGTVLNNIGFNVVNKNEWISDYKFTISFENQRYNGYTTEKILDPFLAGSLPIYSGNPSIDKDFNSDSFINYDSFDNMDQVISKIIEIDQNDELYNHIMNHEILLDPIPDWATREWYIKKWEKILGYDKGNSNWE